MEDKSYEVACLKEEFETVRKIADGNAIATALLMLNRTLTSQAFWDHFGHELAISLRCAIFGGGATDQKVDADIREPLHDIAAALRKED